MKTSEERHPDPQQIERFVRGVASQAENRALVRHLVHGCPQCQTAARKCWANITRPGAFLLGAASPWETWVEGGLWK